MEGDKETKKSNKESVIEVLTKPNLASLIKSANIKRIKKEDIISIIKGDNQYHLVYSDWCYE